jgi:hypothetical protein
MNQLFDLTLKVIWLTWKRVGNKSGQVNQLEKKC